MTTILSLLIGLIGILGGLFLRETKKFLETRHIGFLYTIAEKSVFYAEQWAANQIKKGLAEKIEGHEKLKKALEFIDINFNNLDEQTLKIVRAAIEAKLGEIKTINSVKLNIQS